MNPQMENELDTEIGRALQGLPDLAAPPGFAARTMSALEQPASRRVQPWTQWPVSGRIASLVLALAVATTNFLGLRVVEPGLLTEASHRLAPLASHLASFWNVLGALTGALALAAQQMGKLFMLACFAAAAGACAVCAGCGTIFNRLALAGPRKSQL